MVALVMTGWIGRAAAPAAIANQPHDTAAATDFMYVSFSLDRQEKPKTRPPPWRVHAFRVPWVSPKPPVENNAGKWGRQTATRKTSPLPASPPLNPQPDAG